MNRYSWLAGFVCCLSCLSVQAEDYLLRVDTVATVERPKTGKAPEEKRTRRVEIMARQGSPFFFQLESEAQKLRISGDLQRNEKGTLVVKIRYFESVPIILEPPAKVPVDNETSFFTQVSVAMGEPVKLGGVDSEDSEIRSRITYILSLHKFEPEKEPGTAKEPAAQK